jgi:hypothetical protein
MSVEPLLEDMLPGVDGVPGLTSFGWPHCFGSVFMLVVSTVLLLLDCDDFCWANLSCFRNFARRFWNHTYIGKKKKLNELVSISNTRYREVRYEHDKYHWLCRCELFILRLNCTKPYNFYIPIQKLHIWLWGVGIILVESTCEWPLRHSLFYLVLYYDTIVRVQHEVEWFRNRCTFIYIYIYIYIYVCIYTVHDGTASVKVRHHYFHHHSPPTVNQRERCHRRRYVFGPFLKGYLFVLNKQRETPWRINFTQKSVGLVYVLARLLLLLLCKDSVRLEMHAGVLFFLSFPPFFFVFPTSPASCVHTTTQLYTLYTFQPCIAKTYFYSSPDLYIYIYVCVCVCVCVCV